MHRRQETTDILWEWPRRIRNGGKGRRHISQWETAVEIGKEVHLFGMEDFVNFFMFVPYINSIKTLFIV